MEAKPQDPTSEHRFKSGDAGSYDTVAENFDRYTERFTAHLPPVMLDLAGVKAGGSVLDVGTGTGVVALHAASRTGASGRVLGIDLSEGMLAAATAKARQRAVDGHVSFARMDAERLELDDAQFDAALSLYALRHLPHPDRALSEMCRVLKPGGRLVVAVGSAPPLVSAAGLKAAARRAASIWRRLRGRELSACELIDKLVEQHIPATADPEVAGWAQHHHAFEGSVRKLVEEAGFEQVRTCWRGQYSIIPSIEDFWLLQLTFSSVARKRIQRVEEEQAEALRGEFFRACEAVLARKGRLVYQTGAAIVAATRPGDGPSTLRGQP